MITDSVAHVPRATQAMASVIRSAVLALALLLGSTSATVFFEERFDDASWEKRWYGAGSSSPPMPCFARLLLLAALSLPGTGGAQGGVGLEDRGYGQMDLDCRRVVVQ